MIILIQCIEAATWECWYLLNLRLETRNFSNAHVLPQFSSVLPHLSAVSDICLVHHTVFTRGHQLSPPLASVASLSQQKWAGAEHGSSEYI